MMNFKKSKDKMKENLEETNLNPDELDSTEKSEEEKTKEQLSTDKELAELEEKLKSTELELENYKDRLLRKAAEFENYKRRVENDQMNFLKYAAESLIIKLLPVIDDFERSLSHMNDAKDIESVKEGVKLVYDKLMKMLQDQGVKAIDAVGKPFDVHYHEAIMQRKAEGVEPHTVIEEFEKGYVYKDRVIRHTKVAVSEDNSDELQNSNQESDEDKTNNIEGESE